MNTNLSKGTTVNINKKSNTQHSNEYKRSPCPGITLQPQLEGNKNKNGFLKGDSLNTKENMATNITGHTVIDSASYNKDQYIHTILDLESVPSVGINPVKHMEEFKRPLDPVTVNGAQLVQKENYFFQGNKTKLGFGVDIVSVTGILIMGHLYMSTKMTLKLFALII